ITNGKREHFMAHINTNFETNIYIVNDDYELLYFNDTMTKYFSDLKVGEPCYRALYHADCPCQKCPLFANTDHNTYYIEVFQNWYAVRTAQIDWPGNEACHVIIANRLSSSSLPASTDFRLTDKLPLRSKLTFFEDAAAFLQNSEPLTYCLIAIDIDHFKLFNEWYGVEAGDRFLINVAQQLDHFHKVCSCICGYMGADDFCIILPYQPELIESLQSRILGYIRQYGKNSGFLPAFGIYPIDNLTISVSTMYDRASIALSSVKGNYASRSCYYNPSMMQTLEDNHLLLTEIQSGLENKEFLFYAQPKCNMSSGKIVGLESLIRWNHPTRGIVPPGEFIPLLEKNGFIVDLDIYLWDLVCQHLKRWIELGNHPIPISVNVSRVDIYTLDVADHFSKLVQKYSLPSALLEIEITESAYADDEDIINNTINQLRNAGFTVLMDDFGSGYSSLNMLKDVNVDILKIDMRFLKMDHDSTEKGLGILESIINMTQIMGLRTIAEGVENEEQMKYLLNMGCLYGQGYHFYRPLPVEHFEALLSDPFNIDYRGICAKQMKQIHLKGLLQEDLFSEALLNSIIGPVAVYELSGDNLNLLQVNEHYYHLLGLDPIDLDECDTNILNYVYPDDRPLLLSALKKAYKRPYTGADSYVRRFRKDHTIMWIHFRAFFLRKQGESFLYHCSLSDVTPARTTEKELIGRIFRLENELNVLKEKTNSIFLRTHISHWTWDISTGIFTLYPTGQIGTLADNPYCKEEGDTFILTNFPESIYCSSFLYEEYKDLFREYIENSYHNCSLDEEPTCELPIRGQNNTKHWIKISCKPLFDSNGKVEQIIGYYMDITDQYTKTESQS
ncbi:MAG: EAL domain-containing protein, partial [Lachnospiraceae bacterium]|nr:EAL domain-containing protein [Lachnospiraceae bacterium]